MHADRGNHSLETFVNLNGLRLFYWGQDYPGSTVRARKEALQSLGCEVTSGSNAELYQGSGRVAFQLARRLGMGPLVTAENRTLLEAVHQPYDVIWLDKACFIYPKTIKALRRWASRIVHFTPDPMFLSPGRDPLFLKSIPHFDLHATTKPEDVARYRSRGARYVVLCPKSFNPNLHHPYPLEECEAFQSDVAFIGAWTPYKETEIARILRALPQVQLRVWGPHWDERARDPMLRSRLAPIPKGVFGMDYGRALSAARVGLGLLSWDLAPEEVITDRILEIPACGSLLLAPRTNAIADLFRDGEEALLFATPQEMVDRLGWALAHESDRSRIANRGLERVWGGRFQDHNVVRQVLETLFSGG